MAETKENGMNMQDIMTQARHVPTVTRRCGEPYEKDGLHNITVATRVGLDVLAAPGAHVVPWMITWPAGNESVK